MLIDFAKIRGYETEQLKKLEEALARAKDPEEAIKEFRRLKDEDEQSTQRDKESKAANKYTVAKGKNELIKRLGDGWSLIQNLSDDKYLLKF